MPVSRPPFLFFEGDDLQPDSQLRYITYKLWTESPQIEPGYHKANPLGAAVNSFFRVGSDCNFKLKGLLHGAEFGYLINPADWVRGTFTYSPQYFFRSSDQMTDMERACLLDTGSAVLDVGAGGGAYSTALSLLGRRVTALDKEIGCCQVLRSRGIRTVEGDANRLALAERFDSILLLGNTIGMFASPHNLVKFLVSCRRLLYDDGCIYVQSNGICGFNRVPFVISYSSCNPMYFQWSLVSSFCLTESAARAGLLCHRLGSSGRYSFYKLKLA